jgi:hypothetical protein
VSRKIWNIVEHRGQVLLSMAHMIKQHAAKPLTPVDKINFSKNFRADNIDMGDKSPGLRVFFFFNRNSQFGRSHGAPEMIGMYREGVGYVEKNS